MKYIYICISISISIYIYICTCSRQTQQDASRKKTSGGGKSTRASPKKQKKKSHDDEDALMTMNEQHTFHNEEDDSDFESIEDDESSGTSCEDDEDLVTVVASRKNRTSSSQPQLKRKQPTSTKATKSTASSAIKQRQAQSQPQFPSEGQTRRMTQGERKGTKQQQHPKGGGSQSVKRRVNEIEDVNVGDYDYNNNNDNNSNENQGNRNSQNDDLNDQLLQSRLFSALFEDTAHANNAMVTTATATATASRGSSSSSPPLVSKKPHLHPFPRLPEDFSNYNPQGKNKSNNNDNNAMLDIDDNDDDDNNNHEHDEYAALTKPTVLSIDSNASTLTDDNYGSRRRMRQYAESRQRRIEDEHFGMQPAQMPEQMPEQMQGQPARGREMSHNEVMFTYSAMRKMQQDIDRKFAMMTNMLKKQDQTIQNLRSIVDESTSRCSSEVASMSERLDEMGKQN